LTDALEVVQEGAVAKTWACAPVSVSV